jgi:hypothetical protein
MISGEGFGRKQSWSNRSNVPAIVGRDVGEEKFHVFSTSFNVNGRFLTLVAFRSGKTASW